MKLDTLRWLQQWYKAQCDGDWEHDYGISISNIDNPGWILHIDLLGTQWENSNILKKMVDNGDDDWYFYEIKDNKFHAAGDPNKLELLLIKFREITEDGIGKTTG